MALNQLTKNDPKKVLGIDIGGTSIKAAPVDVAGGKLLAEAMRVATPQPATPKAVVNVIQDILQHFQWQGAIGCGFPGVVKNGITLSAANVAKEWVGYHFRKKLQALTSGVVGIINDADAAGLAEMRFGAGKPYNRHSGGVVMIITLGTGIGSAMFVDSHLVPNTELGHLKMNNMDAEKQAATVIREQEGLTWEVWGGRVNRYLQMLEKLFSPDVFIIGGGVSESSEKFFPFIDVTATLLAAQMGNDAGIVGAALAVEQGGSGIVKQ